MQLRHSSPPEWLYQQYWYRSGVNESMREALADICRKAESLVRPAAGDLVLDIGCNDGTLLRSYGGEALIRAGFEPAVNLVPEAAQGTSKIINAYFSSKDFRAHFPGKKAKIITTIAMFYDLDEPGRFTKEIVQCLHPEGVWINQMSYLPLMLERNAFDNICHEHLAYYSLLSLRHVLIRHGLEVIDVETNGVNGGSFCVTACHGAHAHHFMTSDRANRLKVLESSEKKLGLGNRAIYEEFAGRIHEIRDRLYGFIKREKERGAAIYVYGASTKGNTLLQFARLDAGLIQAAADRSPEKWGKKTIGTGIPIISEAQARAERPDYFLVLPWHFLEEFLQREQEYLKAGGSFIVPLPNPEVITSAGRKRL